MKNKLTDILLRCALLVLFFAACHLVIGLDLPTTILAAVIFYILVLDLGGFIVTRRLWPLVENRFVPKVQGAKVKARDKSLAARLELMAIPDEAAMIRFILSKCEFILYYDAPAGTTYQVSMWLPYLRMLGKEFMVVARQAASARELREAGITALYLKSITDLDQALAGSTLKAVFYVNNGMRNMHMVRYNSMLHIQMLHGESDKPTSYNPVCKMYDILAVSGQLAIDRYHRNGVFIDERQFRIVSRPQVGALSSDYRPGDPIETVLYAPTWAGVYADQNLSSMPKAVEIVETLMKAGFRVVFRPHPLCYNKAEDLAAIRQIGDMMLAANQDGATHMISNHPRFGERLPTSNDCIEAAQFMISDVTSLMGDWIFTKKPFAVIDPASNPRAFARDNPLAEGAAYIGAGLAELPAVLSKLKEGDPLYPRRLQTRRYALGIEDNESPVTRFVEVTRELLDAYDKPRFQAQLLAENQQLVAEAAQ